MEHGRPAFTHEQFRQRLVLLHLQQEVVEVVEVVVDISELTGLTQIG